MEKRIGITVTEEYAGETVRSILKKEGFSRREVSRLKFQGLIACGNRHLHVSDRLQAGDVLTLVFPEKEAGDVPDEIPEIEILYEDEDMIAVNKPSGMPVHASHGHLDDSMGSAMAAMYRKRGEDRIVRTAGRLDAPVSGITVYAKNRPASARLAYERETDSLRKWYIAFASGVIMPESLKIEMPLRKDAGSKRRIADEEGKPAVTMVRKVLAYTGEAGDVTVLLIRLKTGRTHQIRTHLSSLGYPLLGDAMYGGSSAFLKRPALHCAFLSAVSPFTKQPVYCEAPLPEDMAHILPDGMDDGRLYGTIREKRMLESMNE